MKTKVFFLASDHGNCPSLRVIYAKLDVTAVVFQVHRRPYII